MSGYLCLDANVAAKWVFDEEDRSKALKLYHDCIASEIELMAPPHFAIELTNTIRRRVSRGLIEPTEGLILLQDFLEFHVSLPAPAGMFELALKIADQYNRPTAYDAHYIALAQIYECDFWTADLRLLNALGGRLSFVKDLSDYSSAP